MSCQDLSQDTESDETSSRHPSGLCATCVILDLVSLTKGRCRDANEDWHIHLGSLEKISRKRFCPCCRLIVAATKSINLNIEAIEDTSVTIRKRLMTTERREIHALEQADPDLVPIHMESLIEVALDDLSWARLVNTDDTVGTIIMAESATDPIQRSHEDTELIDEHYVRGRNVAPQVNIDLIQHWVQSCNSEHTTCRVPAPIIEHGEGKIRLIDVVEERVVAASLAEDYVALSYVWGPDTAPLLTRRTLLRYTSLHGLRKSCIHRKNLDTKNVSIDKRYSPIPQTISDAIKLVRAIGKRYLWVDSLCIVQDDARDKRRHLPIMDRVYTHAGFVIIAAAGRGARSGIPGVTTTKRHTVQCNEMVNGVDFISTLPAVQQTLQWTRWVTRGWTFQEAMLARRALIFTDGLVYWNCREETWREDMSGEFFKQGCRLLMTKVDSIWGDVVDRSVRVACRTALYCAQVVQFSERDLKDKRDTLWAFMGILKLQAPNFRRGFIWGLPYERLDATLLWSEATRCSRVHQRNVHNVMVQGEKLYDTPYPSWSWLSNSAEVSFMEPCGDSIISEVTWHEAFKLGDDNAISAIYLNSFISPNNGTADASDQRLSVDWLYGVNCVDFGLLHFHAQTARLRFRRKVNSNDLGTLDEASDSGSSGQQSDHIRLKMAQDSTEPVKDAQEQKPDVTTSTIDKKATWTATTVHAPNGPAIAELQVPSTFFGGKLEKIGEVIVLSSNAEAESDEICETISGGLDCGTIKHVGGCKHKQSYNIMLIEWVERVAYRQALGIVKLEAWRDVETWEKEIVLG